MFDRRFVMYGAPAALALVALVAGCAGPAAQSTIGGFAPERAGVFPASSCASSVPKQLPPQVKAAFAGGIAHTKGVPAVAIALIYQGKTYQYYQGFADTKTSTCIGSNTIVELGSLTKTFTAAMLAMAYDGKLSPNADPAKYISPLSEGNFVGKGCPAPPQPTPVPKGGYGVMATMTMSMLASHTSGLPDTPPNQGLTQRPCYSPNELINYVETYPKPGPVPTPPHPYLYSNIGYGTIGYVLQGINKKLWFDQAKSELLTPLKMKHTYDVNTVPNKNYAQGYDCSGKVAVPRWPLNAWPAGGTLRSTLPDMTHYLSAAMQRSGTPLKIAKAMALAQKQVGTVVTPSGGKQGMAWVTQAFGSVTVSWKDGGTDGFNTWIGIVPATKTGIVVLANRAEVPTSPTPTPECKPYVGAPADEIGLVVLEDLK